MDLSDLQAKLRHFAAERDWQPFHTPKNLAMALMVEAAELAEIYQWMTPEQSQAARGDAVTSEHVGEEVADVLLYLLQIADHAGVDLDRAVRRKLSKNARKHPPLRPGLPTRPLPEALVETHVLLDYENVQPTDAQLHALVPDMTDLWLFHGLHQKNLAHRFASLGDRLSLVQIEQRGKNSLDFHLSFYLGYVAARHPDARLVVVANDKGYEPMVGHAKALGFAAHQIGHVNAPKAAAAKTARKAPVKTTGKAPRAVGRPAAKTTAAAAPAPAKKAGAPRVAAKKAVAKTATAQKKTHEPTLKPAHKPAHKPAARKPAPAASTPKATRQAAARPRQAGAAGPARSALPAGEGEGRAAPASRLAEALQKMGARRPRKLQSLRRHLASFLGVPVDAAQAQSALDELIAGGALTVDDSGSVTYRH